MIGVTGIRSTIIEELSKYDDIVRLDEAPNETIYYVLASGVIQPKTWLEQSRYEIEETFRINVLDPISICEKLLGEKENVKICIVGSASGYRGSYDMAYAVSKAAIHSYVEMKKVLPGQKIFGVAPWIIKDSNMAKRRHDYEQIRTGNHILSKDVAREIWKGFKNGVSGEIIKLY